MFPPGPGGEFSDAFATAPAADGSARIPECRRPRKDGALVDVRVSAGLLRDTCGAITGLLAVVEDVTDRKSVEAERDHWFHESQQLLAVCGPDGTIRRVNDAWRRLLHYAPADLVGRRLIELVHPGDRPGTRLHLQHIESDRATTFENRCAAADGDHRWFLWRSTSAEGGGFYAYGTDITDRKAFEQELWDAHAETERLLASISSILIRVDRQGRITRWNSAAHTTFGLDSLAAVGRAFTQCARWAEPTRVEALVAPGSDPCRVEDLRFAGLDGRDHFVTLTVTPLHRGDGGDGFLVLGSDVTEHKILEDQLRQAQKLEAIGQLAAGIAHEINTPTQYVGDNARFLQDAFRDLGGLLDCVVRLRGAVAQGQSVGAGAARGTRARSRSRGHRLPAHRDPAGDCAGARGRPARLAHRPGDEGVLAPERGEGGRRSQPRDRDDNDRRAERAEVRRRHPHRPRPAAAARAVPARAK